MSELKTIQNGYTSYRNKLKLVNLEFEKNKAELDKLIAGESKELPGLNKGQRAEKKVFYEREKERLSDKIKSSRKNQKIVEDEFSSIATDFLSRFNPVDMTAKLDDGFPILLFPLRLETRFKQQQLWLRVYPDDCNINNKEELLSESELANTKSYWVEIWKAGNIVSEEKAAWRSLVNSHGSGRSAWIIWQYKPVNNKPAKPDAAYKILVVDSSLVLNAAETQAARDYWASVWLAKKDTGSINTAFNSLITATSNVRAAEIRDQFIPLNITEDPPGNLTSDKVLLERISFPAYTPKQTSWTQAAKAIVLPDKFVAILSNGAAKKTVLFTKPVKDSLSVSPDPSLSKDQQIKKDQNGDIIVNDDLQWMVDFEKAVEIGMAVKIDLTAAEASGGFEKLFVVGLRFTSDPPDGKDQLEKLFTDHFYSKNGFELLKQGTPTNNTETDPSGHSWTDDPDTSFESIFNPNALAENSDGKKLATCLGIDPAVLTTIPNAHGKDQAEAIAMNTALFPATLGYFMEEMMDPLFNERDINATRAFFANFVSGRGPVPAIRIGKQPYGILPVSVYSRMKFFNENQFSYLDRLHKLLIKFDTSWNNFIPGISHIGTAGDPHQVLLDIIGLHPTSVEFHQRYSQSLMQFYNQLLLGSGRLMAILVSAAMAERKNEILRAFQLNENIKLPILDKYFLGKPNLLSGPFIDDVPDSEINPVRVYCCRNNINLNYIEWLSASDANTVRIENFEGNPAPRALLYLLLRHSLMQAQADAATKLLVNAQIVQSQKEFFDPDFIHISKEHTGKSKFEHLYDTFPTITGSRQLILADYIYKQNILQNKEELRRLKEMLEALKGLSKTPTARLERLLSEHLDCCNYRLDAWITGLVNYRLIEQRENNKTGIYLGAYGWLLDVKPLAKNGNNLGYIHAPSLPQAATAAILRNAYEVNKTTGSGNPFAINLSSDRVRITENVLEGMRNGQSLSALLGYQFERGLHDKYSLGQGEIDMFIYPLRKAFPLVANNLVDTQTKPADIDEAIEINNLADGANSIQNIEASNVIDGLKLVNHIQKTNAANYPFGLPANLNLPPATPAQSNAIDTEVKRIIDIHDAIADTVMSEQVYHVVQGNFERVAGNAEAFSKGSYPPEIAVTSTPRSKVTMTHRVAVQFDATVAVNPSTTPKARIEPSVNKWLKDLLPLPENVLCKISYTNPVKPETEEKISLKHLGLEPVDLLYILNTDTEQAMAELDDRILYYVRYTLSKHPDTTITIRYTEGIDDLDKTKISFFELAALVKSLGEILKGSKFLQPTHLSPLKEEGTAAFTMDDTTLKTRVTTLMNDLNTKKLALEAVLNATKSIGKFADNFKGALQPHISDATHLESIITRLKQDCKDYLLDPSAATKASILGNLGNNLITIADPAVKTALGASYDTGLNEYVTDFQLIDKLVQDSSTLFLDIGLFENNQTGIGFMHEGISTVYRSFLQRLDTLIVRWEKKNSDYMALLSDYDPVDIADTQFPLLQQAEAIISTQPTFPLPNDFTVYKTNHLDPKKTAFDNLLLGLKGLKANPKLKVSGFLNDADALANTTVNHDMDAIDLNSEKLSLATLKEDIVTAISNLHQLLIEKITGCTDGISSANGTTVNNDKISFLINAAKKLAGNDLLLLPRFEWGEPQATEIENSYIAGTDGTVLDFSTTKDHRILPIEDWLGGIARVRKKMHSWEHITFLSTGFKSASQPEFVPLQFPYQENDRWLGLKFRDETDPNEKDENGEFIFKINTDKLLYTAHFATAFDKTKSQCGIVIDEWTEEIPANKETTGIAFHYDQPSSEPSQTMLLVTPPKLTGNWNWNDIIDAMDETLEMAKKRAVEPSQIESSSYAQFLPSTMMAVTRHWITIATNLSVNNTNYAD